MFTHTAALIGGGNKVLLSLIDGLDREQFRPMSILPEHGPMEQELCRREVPFTIMDLRPSIGRIAMAAAVVRLVKLIAKYKIAIVHANDPFTYRAASLAAAMTRTPRVCHLHHPDQDKKSISWAFARRPELIITPTEYVKEKVSEWLGNTDSKIARVVGNPIDVEWFAPARNVPALREQLGMQSHGAHITIIGALTPHKGHDCFLRAAKRILEQRPEAMFNIVGSAASGDPAWAHRLRTLTIELGVEKSVHFWGFVPDITARDVLAASDVFVLPTLIEGFGLVVAEALACGVPVVTSAIRPLEEIVTDGKSGFLVPPSEFECFAQKVLELLDAPEKKAAFSVYGRNHVRSCFSSESVVRRIIGCYEEILSEQ